MKYARVNRKTTKQANHFNSFGIIFTKFGESVVICKLVLLSADRLYYKLCIVMAANDKNMVEKAVHPSENEEDVVENGMEELEEVEEINAEGKFVHKCI